jgi:seryl-tRNA synthetase
MVPDNYLAYIDRNAIISRYAEVRSSVVKGLSISYGVFIIVVDATITRINEHLHILESDIKIVTDRLNAAEAKIKQYKKQLAILQDEEIPVDKIEQYEAEEKAKVEAEKQAEQKKNNTVIGVIVFAIVAFIIYVLKKKSK